MSQYIGLFLILILSTCVYCEPCVVNDFESDFEHLFSNNSTLCSNFPAWKTGSYSNINIQQPHMSSNTFIQPLTTLSCVSSFPFAMEAGGVIEVTIYAESMSPNDFISILANKIVPSGYDAMVASMMFNSVQQNYTDGWHILRASVAISTSFDGYVNFLGAQSEGSKVLIDSFRYISPKTEEKDCEVYTDVETTTIPAATSSIDEDKCLTYDFEEGFESLFTPDNRVCDGFVAWVTGNYSSIGLDGIHEESDLFMTPNNFSSCIASFPFEMSPGGTVEVNVFVEPTTSLDHVIVLAKKLVPQSIDTVTGMFIYEPSRSTFVKGWNKIRVPVVDLSHFKGYLVFLGAAAEGATVLVDSFRYIPPTVSEDHISCLIY